MTTEATVTLAVLTFRRLDRLEALLPHLVDQVRSLPAGGRVLVVDNDPDASARDLVAGAGFDEVRYVHEPRPGIAAARNRALDEAEGAALVFIDDDELPVGDWLAELVSCWRATSAAAVTGPVEPAFEIPPPRWLIASGRFARRRFDTGSSMRSAWSNNLLLDRDAVARLGLHFDEQFGLSGGEDTVFTHELVERGGLIVWCDEAVVREQIPRERMQRSWVLRREFRTGTTWSRMRLRRARGGRRLLVRADLVARAATWLLVWSARLAVALARRDRDALSRGAARFAANAGMLAGAFGLHYLEYRRPGPAPRRSPQTSGGRSGTR